MLSFFSPNSGANGTEGVISIPVPTSNLNNADYKGIEFKIKGTNGNKVRVEVENNPNAEGYNFYGIQFDLTTAWSTKTFTFANDFSQELYWGTPVDKAVGLNNVVKIRFKIQSPLTIFYLDDIKLIK